MVEVCLQDSANDSKVVAATFLATPPDEKRRAVQSRCLIDQKKGTVMTVMTVMMVMTVMTVMMQMWRLSGAPSHLLLILDIHGSCET